MEMLILFGALQAVFFIFLVLSKRSKSISDKILVLLLLLLAIHLAFVYFSFRSGYVFYIENGHFPSGAMVIYYSLIYIYTQSLITQEKGFRANWLFHLIPAVITYVSIIPLAQLSFKEKANLVTHLTTDPYANFVLGIILLFAMGYLFATLRLLKTHKSSIRKMFSYEENISLNWLKILSVLLMFLWVIIFSLITYVFYLENSALTFLPEEHMVLDMQGHSVFVIFILLIGFFGIRQQVIYSIPFPVKVEATPISKASLTINRYEKSGLTKEDSAAYLKELLRYMEDEKPYLNGKLLLKEVAEKLNISNNHLSQVINENLERNFFDFVNGYRVKLAKLKMREPSNRKYTILSLAFDCGFNSKSSFNSIFKRHEGITPTEFINKDK